MAGVEVPTFVFAVSGLFDQIPLNNAGHFGVAMLVVAVLLLSRLRIRVRSALAALSELSTIASSGK